MTRRVYQKCSKVANRNLATRKKKRNKVASGNFSTMLQIKFDDRTSKSRLSTLCVFARTRILVCNFVARAVTQKSLVPNWERGTVTKLQTEISLFAKTHKVANRDFGSPTPKFHLQHCCKYLSFAILLRFVGR